MKPPNTWTPEEAYQAHVYLVQNPEAKDVEAALNQYDAHEEKRRANARPLDFKPERQPAVLGLRTLLPQALGGISIQHFDPPMAEFRKAHPGLKPNSPEEKVAYKDFADEAYAKAYDAAVGKGQPIVRRGVPEEPPPLTLKDFDRRMAEGDAADTKGTIGGALNILDGVALPGTSSVVKGLVSKASPDAAKYLDEAQSGESPGAAFLENVAGSLSPISALGKLGRVIHGAMGPAESIAGGIVKGAATGAGLGVAGSTAGNVGAGIESALRDNEKKGALKRIEDTGVMSLLEAPGAALGGAAIGGLGGLGSGFAGGLRNEATAGGRALRAAEDAGVRTSLTEPGGLKAPPTLQVRGFAPNEHPTDIAIGRAKPMIAHGGARYLEENLAPLEAENSRYYEAADKLGARAHMGPMTKALVKLIRERSFDSTEGGDLPMIRNDALRKELHNTAEPVLTLNHDAQALEQTGGVKVPLDEAIRYGMVDPNKELRLMRPGRSELRERATLPPGADDAAALEFLKRAGATGAGPIPGTRSYEEEKAVRDFLRGRMNTPPETPVAKATATALPGNLDPTQHSVVFRPRELSAKQADEVLGAVDRAAGISEAEGAGRSDPAFQVLPRAAREVRDQLPAIPGITDKYPTATVPGGAGEPAVTLEGRSAMAHGQSKKLAGMKKTMRDAGLPTERFDPTDVLEQDKVGRALAGIGPGAGETERTRAVMSLARAADRPPPAGAPSFDESGKRALAVARAGGYVDDVHNALNVERFRIGNAEKAGAASQESSRLAAFLRDARAAGATYEGPVYRGTSVRDLEALQRTGRNTNTWSTSTGREHALSFAAKKAGGRGVLLEIEGNSGAVPVDQFPESNTFEEALIPKGMGWEVGPVREENGVKVVKLRPANPSSNPMHSAERAAKDVIAARLMRGGGELTPGKNVIPSANEARAAAQLAHSVRYRIDPLANLLGGITPAAGVAGAKLADPVTQALVDLAERTRREHQVHQ